MKNTLTHSFWTITDKHTRISHPPTHTTSHLKMGILENFKKIVGSGNSIEALVEENEKQVAIYIEKVKKINDLEDKYELLTKVWLCSIQLSM